MLHQKEEHYQNLPLGKLDEGDMKVIKFLTKALSLIMSFHSCLVKQAASNMQNFGVLLQC